MSEHRHVGVLDVILILGEMAVVDVGKFLPLGARLEARRGEYLTGTLKWACVCVCVLRHGCGNIHMYL